MTESAHGIGARPFKIPQQDVCFSLVGSPIGDLMLLSDGVALTGLHLHAEQHRVDVGSGLRRAEEPFRLAREELELYFSGALRQFTAPLAPRGTPFQLHVWAELLAIPYGETRSYSEIAAAMGRPKATRAVGQANGRNPISLIIPCHRVIGQDGSLTGYGWGVDRKRWLLAHEGAFPA